MISYLSYIEGNIIRMKHSVYKYIFTQKNRTDCRRCGARARSNVGTVQYSTVVQTFKLQKSCAHLSIYFIPAMVVESAPAVAVAGQRELLSFFFPVMR